MAALVNLLDRWSSKEKVSFKRVDRVWYVSFAILVVLDVA